jgi:hypothetical protein
MKKSYLIMVSVLILSSIIYSQGKSSFQFSGVEVVFSPQGTFSGFQFGFNYKI